jgi:hypothetical protein
MGKHERLLKKKNINTRAREITMKALTREAQENCANGKNYKRKKYIDDFTPN